jgi:thiol-disulfide isomerase/thioredoxin
MTNRTLAIGLAALGTCMLALQIWAKPRPSPEEINYQARGFAAPVDWKDRLAPDFELTMLDGSRVRLADRIGTHVVILNFFATWCGPCRAEMPELQRYYDAHKNDGVLLLAIDAEEKHTAVEAFARELDLRFPVGIDGDGSLQQLFTVDSYPTTVVIGTDGRVKVYETGAIANADVAFADAVTAELARAREGKGISAEDYWTALDHQPPPAAARPDEGVTDATALDGRARTIADAMPCPCGCDDKVGACTCSVSKAIKTRLAKGDFGTKTDVEVMQALNKEFCMKPM